MPERRSAAPGTGARLEIGQEVARRRAFVWALDWPGWCRAGKDAGLAVEALLAARPRYALVAARAGLVLPEGSADNVSLVDSVQGGGGTEFGVPSAIVASDRLPVSGDEADRLGNLIEAAWRVFDRVAADASPTLRKGPRGGGRDTARVVEHVIEADRAYAREIGVRRSAAGVDAPDAAAKHDAADQHNAPDERNPADERKAAAERNPADERNAVAAERAAMLELLRRPSDGSPLAGRSLPLRYAARRIAWHVLDHAWEIEDRDESG